MTTEALTIDDLLDAAKNPTLRPLEFRKDVVETAINSRSPYFPYSPLRIVCAATRTPDGEIFCGPRHSESWKALIRVHPDYSTKWKTESEIPVDGFVDQDMNFYTRKEAAVLVYTRGHFRNPNDGWHDFNPENPVILTSEDLY